MVKLPDHPCVLKHHLLNDYKSVYFFVGIKHSCEICYLYFLWGIIVKLWYRFIAVFNIYIFYCWHNVDDAVDYGTMF